MHGYVQVQPINKNGLDVRNNTNPSTNRTVDIIYCRRRNMGFCLQKILVFAETVGKC